MENHFIDKCLVPELKRAYSRKVKTCSEGRADTDAEEEDEEEEYVPEENEEGQATGQKDNVRRVHFLVSILMLYM